MCRLFGFRSIFSSQVHSSLVGANNAMMNQSEFHPDGWGVAYYLDNTPHVIKSPKSAITDSLFKKVSGVVSSKTVVAHLRKATEGQIDILNCHPFQYGKWIFAHNGNIKNFSENRDQFLDLIDRKYLRFLLGDTDSEVLFYVLLTYLKVDSEAITLGVLKQRFENFMKKVTEISGSICTDPNGGCLENYLTFILTDGEQMFCFNGGKELVFSTHKSKCPERQTCEFLSESCENPAENGEKIQHLIISSEILNAENIWRSTETGDFLFLDKSLNLHRFQVKL